MQSVVVAAVLSIVAVVVWKVVPQFAGNESAPADPLRIETADLLPGNYLEHVLPEARVFVVRSADGTLYVFRVPYSDGAYWLPEFDWAHPAVPCAIFGPDNEDGVLVADGMFRCRKPDYGEFFRREHSWAYDGKNQGYRTADLKVPPYSLMSNGIILQ